MQMTLRWFGTGYDSVRLSHIRQIAGVTGIITTLYGTTPGEAWKTEDIRAIKKEVEDAGLELTGIESVNIHDSIKIGSPDREQYIENYITTLERLGQEGIKLICYNFMPVFDWTRSDLAKPRPDGATVLAYDQKKIDAINPDTMLAEMDANSNGYVLPGWEPERMGRLKELFELYKDVTDEKLFDNLVYFLNRIKPVCKQYGIRMAIHPDDPAWPAPYRHQRRKDPAPDEGRGRSLQRRHPLHGVAFLQPGQRHPGHHPLPRGPHPLRPCAQHQAQRPRRFRGGRPPFLRWRPGYVRDHEGPL
jgi:mannonate dehydratase